MACQRPGIVLDPDAQLPCRDGAPEEALASGRQLMITRLAALASFESQFALESTEHAAQASFLTGTLSRDFPEARYQAAVSR